MRIFIPNCIHSWYSHQTCQTLSCREHSLSLSRHFTQHKPLLHTTPLIQLRLHIDTFSHWSPLLYSSAHFSALPMLYTSIHSVDHIPFTYFIAILSLRSRCAWITCEALLLGSFTTRNLFFEESRLFANLNDLNLKTLGISDYLTILKEWMLLKNKIYLIKLKGCNIRKLHNWMLGKYLPHLAL